MGIDLEFARYLEFGAMDLPARPFLFPAFEGMKEEIERGIRMEAEFVFNSMLRRPITTDRIEPGMRSYEALELAREIIAELVAEARAEGVATAD